VHETNLFFAHPSSILAALMAVFLMIWPLSIVREILKLAAPHGIAGSGVRLNFHRMAPFPRFLAVSPVVCSGVELIGGSLTLATP
jgi:hypothetical protein